MTLSHQVSRDILERLVTFISEVQEEWPGPITPWSWRQ